MYRLWKEFGADKTRQREVEHRLARTELSQIEEATILLQRFSLTECELLQIDPHMAGFREHHKYLLERFEVQMSDVVLNVPPEFRKMLRRRIPTTAGTIK